MPTPLIDSTSTTPKPMMPHSTMRSLLRELRLQLLAIAGSTSPVHRITFEMSRVAW